MRIDEIVLPDTEPETEWILGRPVQKMSPFATTRGCTCASAAR